MFVTVKIRVAPGWPTIDEPNTVPPFAVRVRSAAVIEFAVTPAVAWPVVPPFTVTVVGFDVGAVVGVYWSVNEHVAPMVASVVQVFARMMYGPGAVIVNPLTDCVLSFWTVSVCDAD